MGKIATKGYTDIKQSKKLAEFLPIESADMCYIQDLLAGGKYGDYKPYIGDLIPAYGQGKIRCWSLSALLDVLNKTAYFIDEDASVNLSSYKTIKWDLGIDNSDLEFIAKVNPIDACYEMIMKLHEQKVL